MLLLIAAACNGGNPGFSGGGTYVAPPEDTGPDKTEDSGDTGPDTGDTDTGPDTGKDSDSGGDSTPDSDEPRVPGGDDCGFGLGQVACELLLVDKSGTPWSLWDQYGDPIGLVIGNEYDQHFASASVWIKDVGGGVAVGTVMVHDINLSDATSDDADRWSTTYGHSLSLADPNGSAEDLGWFSSQTTTVVIDEDMVIRSIIYGYVGEDQLDDKLKDL